MMNFWFMKRFPASDCSVMATNWLIQEKTWGKQCICLPQKFVFSGNFCDVECRAPRCRGHSIYSRLTGQDIDRELRRLNKNLLLEGKGMSKGKSNSHLCTEQCFDCSFLK